ncbi:hypothetical protein [Flavobacterium gelatinilyticum]|uniref:hypothetical protein n=1 Tax=Flavobacterium gelatinilyticum TaxID=3003260 RepID=UPI0024814422|nr:hypothetical protein [Flavobacterium gelatinilyticum]
MGAFFTNIQLKTSNFDRTEITEKVIQYITNYNQESGFVKVDNEADADKTIIISFSNDSEWVSVYDEEMEYEGPRKLNKLASVLSKQFKTTALSILVNDSDSVYVGLNNNGILKDSISNLSKKVDFNKSKPNAWTDILLGNYAFDDIKMAWQNSSFFVEGFLTEFAKFINVDSSKLLTGYNYISEENQSEGIKLNFAQKDKKENTELGLTKFSMLSGAGLIDIKEGEKKDRGWVLTNYGTFSKGVDVVIAGECIEKSLLVPETVQINYVIPQLDKKNEFKASFIETVATTGEKIFYARIEDIYIPKGFKPNYPMSPKEGKRYEKIAYDCAIKFNISFIGGNEESGEVAVFFSPLENRQDGSYCSNLTKATLQEWIEKNAL